MYRPYSARRGVDISGTPGYYDFIIIFLHTLNKSVKPCKKEVGRCDNGH